MTTALNEQHLQALPAELRKELTQRLSLIRLAKTGFFKKATLDHVDISRELVLHRAVLDKALIDTFSADEDIKGEVDDWLSLDNQDFLDCCDNAMLNPQGVYASFKLFKNLLKGKNARFQGFKKGPTSSEEEQESTNNV